MTQSALPVAQSTLKPAWIAAGAGGLAVLLLAVFALPSPIWLQLTAILALGWWLYRHPQHREQVSQWWLQLKAGVVLRKSLAPDAELERDGRPVTVLGTAGLLETQLIDEGELLYLRNTEVLKLAKALIRR